MQYQSFPGVKGSSDSLRKLVALRLPSLAGKRCLDVGCNEGFFAGFALFEGATRVVGIDRSAAAVRKASRRFPEADFRKQSWETLPDGPFDVITLLSALHYAEDQEALIHRLMEQLADNGLLVLEISMVPQAEDAWVKVERSIDERYFPTRRKLARVLEPYAWKVVGHSVNQPGDPLQRYVVHVRKLKPYVYLLMGRPGSGKSTLARRLFRKAKVPVLSGDAFYQQLSQGKHAPSQALRELISADFSTATIDKTTQKVFEAGYASEMARLWSEAVGHVDFALDTYVPEAYYGDVRAALDDAGYFPVAMDWEIGEGLAPRHSVSTRADAYARHLASMPPQQACIRVVRLPLEARADEIRWHLDSPVSDEPFEPQATTLTLAGWALTQSGAHDQAEVYVETAGGRTLYPFSRKRRDALSHVFGEASSAAGIWDRQPCGFRVELPSEVLSEGCVVGIVLDGLAHPLASLALHEPSGEKAGVTSRLLQKLKMRSR